MAAPTPVLGYPSKTAAVIALRAQGASDVQIARMIGVTAAAVAALRSSHQRRSGLVPVMLPRSVVEELTAAAEARAVDRPELIRRLLMVITRDRMVGAILDDGVEP